MAGNLTRLMSEAEHLSSTSKVEDAGGPEQTSVARAKRGENITLDMLDELAKPFKLHPWQLLIPEEQQEAARLFQIYLDTNDSGREIIKMAAAAAESQIGARKAAP